jgi:predicted Zn-dependent protease
VPLLDEAEARQLLERLLKLSRAPACQVAIGGGRGGNMRYARNTVTTAGETQDLNLSVTSYQDRRSGVATANQFDDATLERTVRRSEQLAQLVPEDPEAMPPLGPQVYTPVPHAYREATASLSPAYRAAVAGASIVSARAGGCVAAGFLQDGASWRAIANSAGLFAWHRQTALDFSVTMRSEDGAGSGYVARDENDADRFDGGAASAVALQKALASRQAKALEPGKYTVILEPTAAVELLQRLVFGLDARAADEGRSPLSRPGGETMVGQRLVNESVSIWSDPVHADVPTAPWSSDGRPQERLNWIDKGVLQNLQYSRYWAQKQGKPATPAPYGFIMAGGSMTLDELIRDTSKGILITRFWYIRTVDPQTLLLTGLTRDGTFLVENGRIVRPISNFRFNESPIIMLNNVEALGQAVRVQGCMVPAMRIRGFQFTSPSDAV